MLCSLMLPLAVRAESTATGASAEQPPDWARDARWYAIEVPLFANGSKSNDLLRTEPWTVTSVTRSTERSLDAEARYFGGDLAGLIRRLPYLESLGVNTLYLGSVFYGAHLDIPTLIDMRHVSDLLGVEGSYESSRARGQPPQNWVFTASDRLFLEFLEKAHQADLRVVLEFDTGYRLSGGDNRKHQDKTSTAYVQAVARRWTDPNGDDDPSDGVDGWVITRHSGSQDGAAEAFVETVAKLNPTALIIRDPLVSAEENKTLGIPWNERLVDALANSIVSSGRMAPVPRALFSGDDRALRRLDPRAPLRPGRDQRPLSRCLGRERAESGRGTTPVLEPTDEGYRRYKLLLVLQHVLPGAPMTVYGDEVGMLGVTRRQVLSPMWWPDLEDARTRADHYRGDLYGLVAWLHEFRDTHEPVRRGGFRPIMLDEERRVLAFARTLPGDEVIVLANYGDTKQKFMIPAGRPGQLVAVVTPHLSGRSLRRMMRQSDKGPPDFDRPTALEFSGSRQFVNDNGEIRVWVDPMSARLALIRDEEPRR
jgi:hypothetical protein